MSARRRAHVLLGTLGWPLAALAAAFCVARFVVLERAPPGFFSDEIRGALHILCLGESGRSADGARWPLFVAGGGGGFYTPVYLYAGAAWTKLFGPTIASFRALSAAATTVTLVGVHALARRLGGRRLAAWALLAGALSPWAFQFSRIAWDPPLAPAFLVWAVVLWMGRGARLARAAGSGVCFALALYCYPPTRVHAPLLFGALFLQAALARQLRWRELAAFALPATLVALPLLAGTLDGRLNGRGATEAIFSAAYLDGNRGTSSRSAFLLRALLDHLHAHVRPSFLLLTGDFNLRHSTGAIGELGLLDDLALGALAVHLIRRRGPSGVGAPLIVVASAGFAFGVLPAALCWSGVPHSLRAIGAWPFVALGAGAVLARLARGGPKRRAYRTLILAVALAHAAYFGHAYFVVYPAQARAWFDADLKDAVLRDAGDPRAREDLIRTYPEGFRYYHVAYRGDTCASSQARLLDWQRAHAR